MFWSTAIGAGHPGNFSGKLEASTVNAADEYQFKSHERASMLGSPATPDHPLGRRLGFFAIGCLLGITGGLGNALITVNLGLVQGTLGLYSDEATWLTAAYLMINVTANLLLVKYRQQFGLQPFIRYSLFAYATTTLLHLLFEGYWTAIAVRAANGLAASGLTTLALLYVVQSMPAPKRLAGIMIGISLSQLGTPLARILSPGLLESGDWQLLYWFELGLALASCAAALWLPLPASERQKVFERLDFLSVALMAPGIWMLVAALSQGRIEWWTERAWIGYALLSGLLLVTTALLIEHRRANPLIDTRWLGTREMLRLILVAASVRVLLSEQAFGSVGLLSLLGMQNDQMVTLNVIVVVAQVLGLATAVLTFHPEKVARPIGIAVALIAIASFMDAGSTNLSRPDTFYVSQALIGFASLLFMAQVMVIGISRTMLTGGKGLISFVVLFNISQNLGAVFGNAVLGTFQVIREKHHSLAIVQHLVADDPIVAARLLASARALGPALLDPAFRSAEAAVQLAQQVAREANVLAYNDVFMLIGALSVITALWGAAIRFSIMRRGELSPIVQLQLKMAQAQAHTTNPKASA